MVGRLKIEKSSMDINCFLQAVLIVYENGGRISRYQFERSMDIFQHIVSTLPENEPACFHNDTRTQYNKSKLPRYYGFLGLQDNETAGKADLVLTKRGYMLVPLIETVEETGRKECRIANGHKKDFVRLIFDSVLYDSFGKNNAGMEQSCSDIELPKIILSSILILGSVTAAEVLYVAVGMDRGRIDGFLQGIEDIRDMRRKSTYRRDMKLAIKELGMTNFVSDCKFIAFFTNENIGILTKFEGKYGVMYRMSKWVASEYSNELQQLHPVYRPIQLIISGVPGTGKSHYVEERMLGRVSSYNSVIRAVIHPEYSYSDFIGYVVPTKEEKGVKYVFMPGPMTLALERSLRQPKENIYLVVEEMNRGDFASIMGDMFQLLDRVDDYQSNRHGWSEYYVENQTVYQYLKEAVRVKGRLPDNRIAFPANLHVIGTVNTADQNVFVLDTAFRRRFGSLYLKIDFSGAEEEGSYLNRLDQEARKNVFQGQHSWSEFAMQVNRKIDEINREMFVISEDKKLAPYFVDMTDVSSERAFCDKVVYYLKSDVFAYAEDMMQESYEEIYKKAVHQKTIGVFEAVFGHVQ